MRLAQRPTGVLRLALRGLVMLVMLSHISMAVTPATVADVPEVAERRGWLTVVGEFCRQRRLGAIGAAVGVFEILGGLGPNVIEPYTPFATDYSAVIPRPSA